MSIINPNPTITTVLERGTRTENGALAHESTGDKCLDLFSKIGACRNDLEQAQELFTTAYAENPALALRILFWCRDIRGGAGERSVFRHIFKWLATEHSHVADQLIPLVSIFGRWDDVLCVADTESKKAMLKAINDQLIQDLKGLKRGTGVSLLAKWLPSANASCKETRRLGRLVAQGLEMSERQYRKTLTKLRAEIKIVETMLSQKDYESIDFSQVPSRASLIYRSAFMKHQEERYTQFIKDVSEGKETINSAALFPYDLVRPFIDSGHVKGRETLDAQWKSLPNFMPSEGFNGLVVADVSGSMSGLPMAVAISLAIYISERNPVDAWKNKFFTFSSEPTLETVTGATIAEKVENLEGANWGGSTNLEKTFAQILTTAKLMNLKQEELPQKLIIVSDMQFDDNTRWTDEEETNFESIDRMYTEAGYTRPSMVWWNVRASIGEPSTIHESGSHFVSGCSPSILQSVFSGNVVSAVDVMMETVGGFKYEPVEDAYELATFSGPMMI